MYTCDTPSVVPANTQAIYVPFLCDLKQLYIVYIYRRLKSSDTIGIISSRPCFAKPAACGTAYSGDAVQLQDQPPGTDKYVA